MYLYIFDALNKRMEREREKPQNGDILLHEIRVAKNEWDYALKRFNDVSDPDMVDYIIYYIIAAERRYMYLLNKYKDSGKGNFKNVN